MPDPKGTVMQPVSIALTAAAVAAGLLTTCPVAAATSQTDLADWLSRAVVPTPNPQLTVEVQQAIDNFDSASEACTEYFGDGDDAKLNSFWSLSRDAEQHLSSADTVLVGLSPSK